MLQHNSHNHLLEALGPGEVYPGLSGSQAAQAALAERRHASRVPVIKSAKVIAGEQGAQIVYDCLVLDESPSGVLIDSGR